MLGKERSIRPAIGSGFRSFGSVDFDRDTISCALRAPTSLPFAYFGVCTSLPEEQNPPTGHTSRERFQRLRVASCKGVHVRASHWARVSVWGQSLPCDVPLEEQGSEGINARVSRFIWSRRREMSRRFKGLDSDPLRTDPSV